MLVSGRVYRFDFMGQAALQVQLHLNTPNSMAFRIQRDANEKVMLWKGAAFNAGIFGAKECHGKEAMTEYLRYHGG